MCISIGFSTMQCSLQRRCASSNAEKSAAPPPSYLIAAVVSSFASSSSASIGKPAGGSGLKPHVGPPKSAVNDGSVTLQSPAHSLRARSLASALVYGSAISGGDGDVDGPVQPAAATAEPGTRGQRHATRRVARGGALGSVHRLGTA